MSQINKVVLTGDRPTGKMHLGHYAGSLANRVKLQNEHKQYVMVADIQALTHNASDPSKVRSNVVEIVLDNLAVGIDPAKTTIFVQSSVPEIAELTIYFLNLVSLARAERNPTIKEELKEKGYGSNVPLGFLIHPINQAADILAFKTDLVPVGADQLPMIEQANEIAHKFNALYGNTFSEVTPILSASPRLSGTDGKSKMSKSLGNAIFLSDSKDEVERKVMSMYTDPGHIHASDPGKIEGNTVFEFLSFFDPDQTKLSEIKEAYQKGGVGDIEIKKRLSLVLDSFLTPIREKREYLANNLDKVLGILKEGEIEARKVASETVREVKKAMQLNYS